MENKLRVAITGATGLIGRGLQELLREAGHEGIGLKRGGGENTWNVETGEIRAGGPGGRVDAVVHLAGRSVATRWSKKARQEIWDSRVPATQKLCEFLGKLPEGERPGVLVSTSATGIYGNRGDEMLSEESAVAAEGATYLSDICRGWEAGTKALDGAGIRLVHLRIGVVLAKEGGVLAKMKGPTKMFLGGPVGNGLQWMPWISLTDLLRLVLRLVEDGAASGVGGVVNGVADSVRQHEFMRTLGKVLHRPTVFPMPGFLVKMLFGQMGKEVLLGSQRVSRGRVPAGFTFLHGCLEAAIRAELAK